MPRARRVLGLAVRPAVRPALAFALALGLVSGGAQVAGERAARADDGIDYADGPSACSALHAKSERELAEWSKTQPATAYEHPRDDNILGAPWGPMTKALGSTGHLVLASVLPHVGSQLRVGAPALVLAWPWSLPFGPAYTCSRRSGSFTVRDYRVHRAMVEPGIITGQRGSGVFTRLGYRFLYHPSEWVVGLGGGFGSTIDIAGQREKLRLSLSPEAVIQFGHCCDAGYFTLAARYDRYFAGEAVDILGGTLGYTFF